MSGIEPTALVIAGTYVGTQALDAIASVVKERLLGRLEGQTRAFLATRNDIILEWLAELAPLVAATAKEQLRLAEIVGDADAVRAELEARGESHEAHAVLRNYGAQAYQEPIDERRRMLTYAAAGIVDVKLSVADHSRVERIVRELDPGDVLALYALSRTHGSVLERQNYESEHHMRAALLETRAPSRGDALYASNCVRHMFELSGTLADDNTMEYPHGPRLGITRFGDLILRVMRGYCRATTLPFTVPGRESFDGERGRDEAIAAFPVLMEIERALYPIAATSPRSLRFSPQQWSHGERVTGKNCLPPSPGGCARIDIEETTQDVAEALRDLAPLDIPEPEHAAPIKAVRVRTNPNGRGWWVRIIGPRDVLRHVADAVDMRWL